MPTLPIATSVVTRAKPVLPSVLAPERPEILVDDMDLVRLPSQLPCTVDQGVLAAGGFLVVLDLRELEDWRTYTMAPRSRCPGAMRMSAIISLLLADRLERGACNEIGEVVQNHLAGSRIEGGPQSCMRRLVWKEEVQLDGHAARSCDVREKSSSHGSW